MTARKTWFESFLEEHGNDPEYLTEKLVLRINREIRRRMHELGVTQTELADRLGVSQAHVSRLLNNRNLTLRSLAVLADALDAEWEEPRLTAKTAAVRAEDYAESEPDTLRRGWDDLQQRKEQTHGFGDFAIAA